MTRPIRIFTTLTVVLALARALTACGSASTDDAEHIEATAEGEPVTPVAALPSHEDRIARGRYLVEAAGCSDCHTPLTMGPEGPVRDTTHLLAGHPEDLELPPAPALPEGPWVATASATMTAWSGPWGTSYTANLTPDPETGLGRWSEDTFVATIRNGRHMGMGRPLLPPMPFAYYRNFSDDDLRAIFAYLQSVPPVHNRVPAPIPPQPATASAPAAPEHSG